MFLNPFWLIPGFQDFIAPVLALQNSLDILQTFAGFWLKSGYFTDISPLLHRSKEGRESSGKGGLQESRNFKIGQNVLKGSKTIIESHPSAAPCRTKSVPSGPAPPHSGL